MSFRRVFILLSLAIAVSLPILSFDFGITEDEQLHNQHGKSILEYFQGKSDRAARDPLDASGRLTFEYGPEMRDESGALNIYGGFFDLLCAASHRYLSPFGEFENRHFINALFGVLLIVSGGIAAAQLAGWRAGVLALLLMALCPRIVAHSMNNPVDLPFAALYMFGICFILRFVERLPRPSAAAWIPVLIGIPLATDIRIAGLVLIFYLVLFACVRHFPRGLERDATKRFARSLGITLLLAAGAYLLVSVPWPLAHRDPLGTPLMALRHLSRLETFDALDLFEGRWINRLEIPWYFVPKWFLIGTPLFVPLGLALSPLVFTSLPSGRPGMPPIDRRKVAMVAFTFLFPVLFVILRKSNVYNDARHVLFALPPSIVLCAVAFESVARWKGKKLAKVALAVVLAGTMIEPLLFMIRNHPNEGVYFSPLIGGVDGAWRRYETDYWGNSTRQAVEWIQANTEPADGAPIRIRIWYGDQTKAAYYAHRKPGYEHVLAEQDSSGWDYCVIQTVEAKFWPGLLSTWPPPGTVYEVLADDTPLCAVTINHRNREPEAVLGAMEAWIAVRPTPAHYFSLGSMAYLLKRYEESAGAYRRAAELKPDDARTWHALGAAYGMLENWDGQVEACKRALRIDPDLEMARDNLRFALRQRVASATGEGEAPLSHDEYVSMGLDLYEKGRYEEAVETCRLALRKDPASAIAYNNMCAAYNAMEEWEKARDGCETALALQPDFPRARNNLKAAMAGERR